MRRTLPTLLALLALLAYAAPLTGQMKAGHVYTIAYSQVLPGKEDAYNKAVAEIAIPVLEEMVKRGAIISYQVLNKVSGSGEYSGVFITEFADSATFGAFAARRNEAAQAVLHKPWSQTGFGELRRFIRLETFRPAGQQP